MKRKLLTLLSTAVVATLLAVTVKMQGETAFTWMLQLTGASMVILALAHFALPALLHWSTDLRKLDPINRQVFLVHCVFVAGGVFMLGAVCALLPRTLLARTELALVASMVFAITWLVRLICQLFVFTPNVTASPRWNTILNTAGTAVWVVYCGVFDTLVAHQCGLI